MLALQESLLLENSKEAKTLRKREFCLQVTTVLAMLVYPLLMVQRYVFVLDSATSLRHLVQEYFREIWYGIAVTTILLVATSLTVLRLIPKVFANEIAAHESEISQVKWTVLTFLLTFILKLTICATFDFLVPKIDSLNISLIALAGYALLFWSITELLPVTYVMYTHHYNFRDLSAQPLPDVDNSLGVVSSLASFSPMSASRGDQDDSTATAVEVKQFFK